MIRKLLRLSGVVILLLALAVALNTFRQGSRQIESPPAAPLTVDSDAAAERLAGALRFRTVSHDDRAQASGEEFLKLHAYLAQKFPRTHAALKLETVNQYSLLYTWPGSDAAARPIMLMAHQDVVPIAPGTEKDWQVEPFAGVVKDGFIWGRGSWDDKGNLLSILEAVELLTAKDFKPRQTVYLAFGHDEEIGGDQGARAIATLLKSRGVRLDFALDEGLLITEGIIKGIDHPIALIGIAEKGAATISLTVAGASGHSSMPSRTSSIGTLSRALAKIEDHPMPAGIRGVAAEMFATIAPEMNLPNRVLLSNLWLFGPLVQGQLEKGPSTNAMLRTTTALTVVQAGNKVNVLPGKAEAMVNFRLLPGDTADWVLAHVKSVVANDSVSVAISGTVREASGVSRTDTSAYRLINQTLRAAFPGIVVAPGLMIGGTDGRHMESIADNVYRFAPTRAKAEDLPRFHGTNERMSVANYAEAIQFYAGLLSAANAAR